VLERDKDGCCPVCRKTQSIDLHEKCMIHKLLSLVSQLTNKAHCIPCRIFTLNQKHPDFMELKYRHYVNTISPADLVLVPFRLLHLCADSVQGPF